MFLGYECDHPFAMPKRISNNQSLQKRMSSGRLGLDSKIEQENESNEGMKASPCGKNGKLNSLIVLRARIA
jgi:hypothetical protein